MTLPRILLLVLLLAAAGKHRAQVVGPVLGDVTPWAAQLWVRPEAEGRVRWAAWPVTSPTERLATEGRAARDSDHCVTLQLRGLKPGTHYRYSLTLDDHPLVGSSDLTFRTAEVPGKAGTTRIAFGSCAHERAFPRQAVWGAIEKSGSEAVVLLGDTPYIDSTELAIQRRRHREFLAHPDLATLLRRTPLYSTWDDHDFGRNDTDGRLDGKQRSRRAFVEYRPNPSHGRDGEGIFTRFRRGDIEVFLLDTRWFAGTAPSPVDPERPTLLGWSQWTWLRTHLLASTARFKILACGMVWNGAVRPFKRDHWATYPHERDALFRFIGERSISGVVLVGGDIHRSRVIRHATRALAGYDLTELITSPLANVPVPLSKMPHPGLRFDAALSQSFLLLTSDPKEPSLDARIRDETGKDRFRLALSLASLGGGTRPR